jgi:transposase
VQVFPPLLAVIVAGLGWPVAVLALMDERRAWQQRIHAQLFHQGCPPIRALLSQTARDGLVTAELSPAGQRYVEAALLRIDELNGEIDPLRRQLVSFAKRPPGCRALQAR